MRSTTRVSVVVPTRDRPTLLRAALAALRAQDHPGTVEVLVVFDQSAPDASLAGGDDRYRVRVLANDRAPGLAGARNTGILAATGECVAFCDDDDVWLPGKLAAQLAALDADPAAELVCTGIRVRYADRLTDRTLAATRVPLAALLRDRLTTLHPSTFLFRRAALVDGIGLVDESIPGSYAEDYELLLRAARRTPVRNLPVPLVDVRWHAQSFFTARWRTIAEALRWLLDRYPEFGTVPRGTARLRGQIAFAEAAAGNRWAAVRWAARTMRASVVEPRGYLALAVAATAVDPERLLRLLHRQGRGI